MKKLTFLFLLFTSIVLGQNFTIRSLGAHGTPTGTDLFLFSNSAGALTKLSFTSLQAALDDLNYTWTGTHAFNGTVTFNTTLAGNASISGNWDFDGVSFGCVYFEER